MSGESYYNTTRVRGHQLRLYELQAEFQDAKVLEFMENNPSFKASAEDIGRLVLPRAPRTSWGRALCNLTTLGLLEKTDHQVDGKYDRPIYTWRLVVKTPEQGILI